MNKFAFAAALAVAVATVPVQAEVKKNNMVFSADGTRIGKVTRVAEDGSAIVIYRGKAVRLAGETLSEVDGKVTTSLTWKEVRALD